MPNKKKGKKKKRQSNDETDQAAREEDSLDAFLHEHNFLDFGHGVVKAWRELFPGEEPTKSNLMSLNNSDLDELLRMAIVVPEPERRDGATCRLRIRRAGRARGASRRPATRNLHGRTDGDGGDGRSG